MTSQRNHSSGRDLTMKAAINTPTMPPNVSPSDAPQANLPVWKKRKLATGCSSAQAPIMIGNAAMGCMPSSASVIMQGAYRPMPALISAPRIKLTPTANGNFQPTRLMAVPPPGRACKLMAVNTAPARSSAIPMVIWIARRDSRATTSAPSQEPAVALRIMLMSRCGSTSIAPTKITASVMAAAARPTLRVPGMRSSGTMRRNLKMAVVGAKDPMPKVSKKAVTNPTTISSGRGQRRSGVRGAARTPPTMKATVAAPRAA